MNHRGDALDTIKSIVENYLSSREKEEFIPGLTRIPLAAPTFGSAEIMETLDSLLTGRVTQGEKVRKFEELFASYIGVKQAVMVNSGSSANLIMLSALTNPLFENKLLPGDEVITPAVTWATTVWPIINCNLVPVLVDVDQADFNIDPAEIRRAITHRTRAILPVHLLGNPCNMAEITRIAAEHSLYIIEDACESHGAEFRGKKAGSFGGCASFSFYFSHHISTIEGGMVLTDNNRLAEIARALRSFGWTRDSASREAIAGQYPAVDSRFLFYTMGYNLRPTEIQGAFGLHQIGKLDGFITTRQQNARFWNEQLAKYERYFLLPGERPDCRQVWLGYPLTVRPGAPFTRKQLTDFLESKGVETRPIMAGNIAGQPAMKYVRFRAAGSLPNSQLIMNNSFYFGNHQAISPVEREAVVSYFDEFMQRYK